MRPLALAPFTPEAYAPYGEIIVPPERGGRLVNQGYARRYDHVAELVNLRPHATLNLAAFRCKPLPPGDFTVTMLERHAASTQAFFPLRAGRFLVVVALGGDRPDLTTMVAFLGRGDQGLSYRPGVWHLPLVVFDEPAEFTCLVYEDGSAVDCEVAMLSADEQVVVRVD